MPKVSAVVVLVVRFGLLGGLLGGCAIDPGGLGAPAVTGSDAGAPADTGKNDVPAASGGAGGGAAGSGGRGGSGGAAGGSGGARTDAADAPVDVPVGPQKNGAACGPGVTCASGYCVDGLCCDSACTAVCMACAGAKTGHPDGECRIVKIGTDPDNECEADTGNKCGRTGQCGIGACELVAAGAACADASCSGRQLTEASTCNGNGQCVTPMPANCPGLFKCASLSACATTCTEDRDCVGTASCDKADGKCKQGIALGGACDPAMNGKDCASGQCVDGVCCESACGGGCMACTFAKTGVRNGQCAPVAAGTDPDNECAVQDATTCGTTGVCNGNGACRKYPDGTACGSTCCNQGPGNGARPCTYVCKAGACDMADPVPEVACGGQSCCCPGAGPNNTPACTLPITCLAGCVN